MIDPVRIVGRGFPIALAGIFALLTACTADEGDGEEGAADSTGSTGSHADHGESSAATDSSTTTAADGSSGDATTGDASGEASGSSTGDAVMDTWENWAHPQYFTPYCIECHPGQSTRDFNVYEVVVENVVHIRCGSAPTMLADCDDHIEPGHLPIGDGPFPTDDERWRLVDWIDAGMSRDP